MATPDFVLALRERIGHAPLWLTGVTAVVLRGLGTPEAEVLLVRRADNGAWTPVTGIIDPGEEPAVAAEREVLEEAAVVAVAERLSQVQVLPQNVYENGDITQYIDLVFRCRYESGEPYPADGENSEARWFPLDALPAEVSQNFRTRIALAASDTPEAHFVR
ncbi:ADP-ribose pyrophosphatase [Plantibacter sp. Leaf171]|jgi:8-oxo-dGTP pyrophosphatase MutT (NUDIX family)|uniref:NUDIX hydrolase n=1 Tax=unclassified Plantibacter TaxID=2624265 RepID=UPI0006FBD33D|nr:MULTISPECIES: NUDIX domain-containing protein [unclassified Plantibacter]KQM16024.1 ADP-ribose pyrophosphatase [Plantibacter sp. Leaf1]KQQ52130.1 ADP-ribose pyrophosphatase [Plantibacter sp. Leaf314]KQR59164.1 ADP-ribose pyrophosphatase [Plantibacter sp. Leaf171]